MKLTFVKYLMGKFEFPKGLTKNEKLIYRLDDPTGLPRWLILIGPLLVLPGHPDAIVICVTFEIFLVLILYYLYKKRIKN